MLNLIISFILLILFTTEMNMKSGGAVDCRKQVNEYGPKRWITAFSGVICNSYWQVRGFWKSCESLWPLYETLYHCLHISGVLAVFKPISRLKDNRLKDNQVQRRVDRDWYIIVNFLWVWAEASPSLNNTSNGSLLSEYL